MTSIALSDTHAHLLGPREHYAAHGENASAVIRNRYHTMASLGAGAVQKQTTLAFRKGRDDEREAVQMEITIDKTFDSGRRTSEISSMSITPELWAHIVEFVEKSRTVQA